MSVEQLELVPLIAPINTDGRYRAAALVESLSDIPHVHTVIVPGDPPSKARPRWNRSHKPYTPKKTIEGQRRIEACLKDSEPYDGNVAMVCIFYRSTRQRIDVDNLLKAVLDAATNAGLWQDDSQVTALVGLVEYDRDYPRTIIAFGHHDSTLKRGIEALATCQACGTKFAVSHRRADRAQWCSRQCRMTLAEPVPCRICGEPFKRRSGNQRMCSRACQVESIKHYNKKKAMARTHCSQGHELTPENVYVTPGGHRRCRRCQAIAAAAARARKNTR